MDASIEVAKKLRSMSSAFETPIFYFKPYPGSAIVTEAVARGFELPRDARSLGAVRLRRRPAGPVGLAAELHADRAIQVLPGSRLEARRVPANAGCRRSRACAANSDDYRWPIEMRGDAAAVAREAAVMNARARPAGQPADHLALARALSARRCSTLAGALEQRGHRRRHRRRQRRGRCDRRESARARSRALRRGRCHRHGRAAGRDGAARCREACARASPRLPIVWGGYFPTLYPDAALNGDLRRLSGRGQGENAHRASCWMRCRTPMPRHSRASPGSRGGEGGRVVNNRDARTRAARSRSSCCRTRNSATRARYLARTFPGRAHGRAPGGARLPLPLHVLRRGRDVPRRDAAAAAARLERELTHLRVRIRRRLHPVLRPQLLRPRRGHGAAARSARPARAAVVVLRARRCAGESLEANPGRWCARAGCGWPTSAPRRPTTRLLKSIRKGTRSDQTLEVAELCRAQRRDPRAVVHGGAARGSRRRDRTHLRFHPPGETRQSARRDHRLRLHAAAGRDACRIRIA